MNKAQFAEYLERMSSIYEIKVEYGEDFAEATSPYLEGVVEYGSDIYQATCALCSSIEVTEEILQCRLYDKKH